MTRIYRVKDWDELMTVIYGYELKRIVWMERGKGQLTVGVR
jgi:hypothetical protein